MPWYEVVHKIKTVEQHVFAVQADSEDEAEQKVRDHSDYDTDKPDIRYTDFVDDVTDTEYDCQGECDPPTELVFPDDIRPKDRVLVPAAGVFTVRGVQIGGEYATFYWEEDQPSFTHSRSIAVERAFAGVQSAQPTESD